MQNNTTIQEKEKKKKRKTSPRFSIGKYTPVAPQILLVQD